MGYFTTSDADSNRPFSAAELNNGNNNASNNTQSQPALDMYGKEKRYGPAFRLTGNAEYDEGQARGYLARMELENKQNQTAIKNRSENRNQQHEDFYEKMAMEELGIKKEDLKIRQSDAQIRVGEFGMKSEEFGWKREDRDREVNIRSGLMTAVQHGGYGSAIDYLKSVDPERAIKFHVEKLKLDEQIMSNEVLQATAPLKKNEALFASYGMAGKMFTTINNMPPEQQSEGYKAMLPMIRKVFPNAPAEWGPEAQGAGILSVALGTPDNIMYANNKKTTQAQGDLGKLLSYDQELADQGIGVGDPRRKANLVEAQRLDQEQANTITQGLVLQQQYKKASAQAQTAESVDNFKMDKMVDSSSKVWNNKINAFSDAWGDIQTIIKGDNGPKTSYAQARLKIAFIKGNLGGNISDYENKMSEQATGIPGLVKKYEQLSSGMKVNLNDAEWQAMAIAMQGEVQEAYRMQLAREQQFKDIIASGKYENVDATAVRWPSQMYDQMEEKHRVSSVAGDLLLGNDQPSGQQQINQAQQQRTEAPRAALQYLQQHPEAAEQFKAKYGYVPQQGQ